ncbi:hypothetical protein CsSME_00014547 [Camellia sinensis var. sinensis]
MIGMIQGAMGNPHAGTSVEGNKPQGPDPYASEPQLAQSNKTQPRSHLEGSIAKGYPMEECMNFCAQYLNDVETKSSQPVRNYSGADNLGHAIGENTSFYLDNTSWVQAHRYILFNTSVIIMGRKRKPDHPRRMMSDVLHNRTSVAPPSEEASHRPASEGPLVPPPSEGPLVPPYRPPSVAPQQLPCTQPPRLPSVRSPSVAPQQLSSSAYEPSADPSTSSQSTSGHVSSSSTSTRRGRGCAKGIKEWGTGKKLDIQFDGNYCPIGDNVAKLTTQLGIIVRNGNIIPLTFLDWNNVPDDIVDAIWKDVKDNLNICPEEYKPICMKNCNNIWKDHKNKLKAKYFKPRSSDPNMKDDVPMNIVPSQWEQLVEY